MTNKKRWQKLAGVTPNPNNTDVNKDKPSLKENLGNLGMVSPGVIGNPFGNRPKEPEYNLDGIFEDMNKEYISEENDDSEIYDEKSSGPTTPGHYWFKDFINDGPDQWQIVKWNGKELSFAGGPNAAALFKGSKEEYKSKGPQKWRRLGDFIGPLSPPKS